MKQTNARRWRAATWWSVVASACVGLVSGCGEAGPEVQLVKGKLLVDGEAVGGVTVMFTPTDGGGMAAVGGTDEDGAFQLTARRGHKFGQGTPEGKYKVTVSKRTLVDERTGRTKETMPARFTVFEQTPLVCDVARGVNDFVLEVVSEGD